MRYKDQIDAQNTRNPCLTELSEYLTRPGLLQKCRIVILEFFDGTELPTYSELAPEDLDTRLRCDGQERLPQATTPRLLGQLLIIEDISPELIERLGSRLDIDPLFFATYIHSPWRRSGFHTPQTCCLPSRQRAQNFVSLVYRKSLTFTGTKPNRVKFLTDSNQHRKVTVLPESTGPWVGLAKHNCAVLLKETKPSWVGIILADPPVTDRYIFPLKTGPVLTTLPNRPFLGEPEDFNILRDCGVPSLGQRTPHSRGMLDELVHHYALMQSTILEPSKPTLQALSYLPLKIVAAEWINYISVMSFCLKHYETSDMTQDLQAELDRLSSNLRTLQTWRRRVLASIEKICYLIRYLKLHEQTTPYSENWTGLREDYEFIYAGIEDRGKRVDSMIPVITSFIQLVESRRALLETANVTRLTVLAVIFVPLSFVATLFSMNEKFGPGGSKFWMYFVIALPISLLVLFLRGFQGLTGTYLVGLAN